MRVGILNWRDIGHPQAGGSEVVVHREAVGLTERGHTVTLYTSRYSGSSAQDERYGYRVLRGGGRFSVYPRAGLMCRRESREIDVLLEHVNGIPWLAPYWSSKPVVCYLYHRVGPVFFQELSFPFSVVGYMTESGMPRMYQSVPCACLGPSSIDSFEQLGFRRTQLTSIPPGVDHSVFRNTGIKSEMPTFVVLGPLKRYKRIDQIIRAFSMASKATSGAQLLIAGWQRQGLGVWLSRYAAELDVAKSVKFLGFISEEEKVRLLQRAWALIYASEREGWGLGVLEAGACGTPSVVPDVAGLRDTVVDRQTGLFYRSGHVDDLASKMEGLVSDQTLRENLGRGAVEFAGKFTWDEHVRKLETLLAATSGT